MSKEIKCPECGSYNIKKIPYYKKAVDEEEAHGEYQKKAEYMRYECIDCGLRFLESDLRE
jgi:transposase-like protein